MSGVSWWCLRDFGQVWGTGMCDTKLLVKVYIKCLFLQSPPNCKNAYIWGCLDRVVIVSGDGVLGKLATNYIRP